MAERFDKFTEGARKVLQLAQEEAQRFNHNYIGTEHLLVGLLREDKGIASEALVGLGVDLAAVRRAINSTVGRGERSQTGDVGLTPGAKRVIEFSVEEARRLGHNHIGTQHMLLGLGREKDGVAAELLESLGVSLERVRQNVEHLMFPELHNPPQDTRSTLESRGAEPQSRRTTTNPWLDVGERGGVLRASLDSVIAELEAAGEVFAHRPLMTGPGYECGIVRFAPRAEAEDHFIAHTDKDVICQVLRGRGRLRLRQSSQSLIVGDVCRVLANMEHDFLAVEEPLVLFYFTIMVPERQG